MTQSKRKLSGIEINAANQLEMGEIILGYPDGFNIILKLLVTAKGKGES